MSNPFDYESHDAVGLAALVRAGEVTPAELVEEAIRRIEERDGALNAVVHRDFARARAQAAGPVAGPLAGVPFLLKDLRGEDAGQPSTSSTQLLVDHIAEVDSTVVARLKAAGLIILGRTNTPEFGIHGTTESDLRGPCRNPWNLDRSAGGSSGGSGAAVAAGYVPMAHASDGGGSIRIPASHNGLVGLKPTRARVPAGPHRGEGWNGQAAELVVSRSVRDTAVALDVLAGPEPGDPYQVLAPERPYADEVGRAPGKLRIALTDQPLFADELHADNATAVREAAELAESLGHHVEHARPAFDRDLLTRAYLITVATGVAVSIRETARTAGVKPRAEDFELVTWLLGQVGERLSAADYEWHRAAVQQESRRIAAFFERYDVLLTATVARPPVHIGELAPGLAQRAAMRAVGHVRSRRVILRALDVLAARSLAPTPNTMLFNQTGQPAISLPLHWSREGLPIGTQWVGRFGDEATLIRLASQLEAARPWASRRPVVAEGWR